MQECTLEKMEGWKMKRRKKALLAGATGLVGSELLKKLLESPVYEEVTVIGRRATGRSHPKLSEVVTDLDRMGEHAKSFAVDDVYCCLGTTIKKAKTQEAFRRVDYGYPSEMARLAASEGAERYLIISSIGAGERSPFFYSRVKGEVEAAVSAAGIPAVHIFRPSLLLGDREEFRFGERVGGWLWQALGFAMAGPLAKYRPIRAQLVAEAMLRAAQSDARGVQVYESDRIRRMARVPKSWRRSVRTK
jgi:uncharacterized protein YbjT (DUF2867 family)